MRAAIYARKSTDQNGVADDQKSVTRQVDEGRAFAARNGWTVIDEHIYVDDGISGAEFANRPGFVRLMNALKTKPPFQVLVMSEESRLGREQLEVGYALKQLVTSGVRVFSYLTGDERTLDSPMDKAMLALQTMADEMEREKARQRTYDAMQRKARAGHATGGRCFGYDNVEATEPQGERLYVYHVVNEREAEVVRRIFELTAAGHGLTHVAKALNAEAAPSPRAQQGRPKGWCPSSIREVLRRTRYRGEIHWGKTKKRDKWGQVKPQDQPKDAHLIVQAPAHRIVSDELWESAHAQMSANLKRFGQKTGTRGRPPGSGAKYLLAGVLRCGVCGASMEARSRSHGKERVYFYGCSAFHRKGASVCSNKLVAPMRTADLAVLQALRSQLLAPSVISEALDRAAAELTAPRTDDIARAEGRLADLEVELANLAKAVAVGGNIDVLLAAMKERQTEQEDTQQRLNSMQSGPDELDIDDIRDELRSRVREWRKMLQDHPAQTRLLLQQLIEGRLEMLPREEEGESYYEFAGMGTLSPIVSGIVPHKLASPTGFEPVF